MMAYIEAHAMNFCFLHKRCNQKNEMMITISDFLDVIHKINLTWIDILRYIMAFFDYPSLWHHSIFQRSFTMFLVLRPQFTFVILNYKAS